MQDKTVVQVPAEPVVAEVNLPVLCSVCRRPLTDGEALAAKGGLLTNWPTYTTGDSDPDRLDHRTLALESIGHLRTLTDPKRNAYEAVERAYKWLAANDQSVQELLGNAETEAGDD